MTRLLVLFRHAKADHPVGDADFDRPLNERGRHDARAAGEWLRTHHVVPDLVICSAAKRARHTWRQAATALEAGPTVDYRREVYESGADGLLDLIRAVPSGTGIVAVVGHNPALEVLSGTLDPNGGAGGMRTGGIAVHTVSVEWADLEPATAPLTASATPRA